MILGSVHQVKSGSDGASLYYCCGVVWKNHIRPTEYCVVTSYASRRK